MTTEGDRGRPPSHSDGQQPRRRSKPPAGWVFGAALGTFFAAFALLAFQLRAGEDPALGEPTAQLQQPEPRRVLIRRVIERVVIHHPPTTSSSSSPAAVQTSVPRTTTPAPAQAAPEPAPLTTQSS